MLYDSRTEGLNTGEESRFAKQLRYLYPEQCHLEETIATADISQSAEESAIQKTEEDVKHIRGMRFSATSLQAYLTCQAKFYYRYVQELKPEGEVKETLDPSMEGTVCHEVLKEIYSRGGAEITEEFLKGWLKRRDDIRKRVLELIREQLHSIEIGGQDLVTSNILVKFITRVLECDIKQIRTGGSIKILALEQPMSVDICGHNIQGTIDRLDSLRPGMVRVVDYKTGKDIQSALELSELPKSFDGEKKAALQFFIYDRMIAARNEFAGKAIHNSMYAMKNFFTEDVQTYPYNEEMAGKWEELLKAQFEEMEDTNIPFKRTEDGKTCEYCDYRILCGRLKKR